MTRRNLLHSLPISDRHVFGYTEWALAHTGQVKLGFASSECANNLDLEFNYLKDVVMPKLFVLDS